LPPGPPWLRPCSNYSTVFRFNVSFIVSPSYLAAEAIARVGRVGCGVLICHLLGRTVQDAGLVVAAKFFAVIHERDF